MSRLAWCWTSRVKQSDCFRICCVTVCALVSSFLFLTDIVCFQKNFRKKPGPSDPIYFRATDHFNESDTLNETMRINIPRKIIYCDIVERGKDTLHPFEGEEDDCSWKAS